MNRTLRMSCVPIAAALVKLSLVLGVTTTGSSAAPQQEPLVVCAVPTAMPRTARANDGVPRGLDATVARMVAGRLGREIEFHWCASSTCSWNCLRDGRCDVAVGQPHGSGPSRGVAWSVPYAGSQFGLVVAQHSKGIRTLADLRGQRVGVATGTVALSRHDHQVIRFKTREDLLNHFLTENLHAAFMDADFAAWYLHSNTQLPLRLVAQYVPREHWNMAFAVRGNDAELLSRINRALSDIRESGEMTNVYAELGVPYRAPFTGTARRTAQYDTWKRIRTAATITVSMDPANLPYSSASSDRPGFDVELAQAVARELGVKLRMRWIDVRRETAIGELLDGECDLAFGAAIEPRAVDDEEELAGRVIYSRPYYGSGYLLVNRNNGPQAKSLSELKDSRSRRLGTEAGSVADYRLRQRGYLRRLFPNQLAVLKSLHDEGIDHAYVWANVGWTLHMTPEFDLSISADYTPEDHWNIAIAMRSGDEELKRQVDTVIVALVKERVVARALAKYHVPYFPAFTKPEMRGVRDAAAAARGAHQSGVLRRPVTQRGLEPQMFGRHRSRKGYSALERIRSAGVLVVGLDQNNLPFSTAHPRPAGLDFDIANLLAKQLGVPLRVYWAYSSHDSYPSKLTNKKFCDMILGVMPDDRFGKRVLYSKPYYVASYQLVVAAHEQRSKEQLASETLGVEPGIAARGIDARTTREYPSLSAVLEAVLAGEVDAGYVISTRGHWLAEQRWPGQLKFLGGFHSADRFPICAAVRKTDADLRPAIDGALDRLARTGELTEVFARWHIPYAPPNTDVSPSP